MFARYSKNFKSCPDLYNPVGIPGDGILFQSDFSSECRHRQFLAGGLQFFVLGVSIVELPKATEAGGPNSTKVAGGNTFNIYVQKQRAKKRAPVGSDMVASSGTSCFFANAESANRSCARRLLVALQFRWHSIFVPLSAWFAT